VEIRPDGEALMVNIVWVVRMIEGS
jgi:hypothetical protein